MLVYSTTYSQYVFLKLEISYRMHTGFSDQGILLSTAFLL